MPDLNPGATFAGHRIEGIAGRGGMGTVYRATHLALDHVVALKVISPRLAADDAFRERFRSESRIAVSLRHPNVVPIHHAGEEDGLLFVTMDLVDGPDLRGMLIAGGTLPQDRAIAIIEQVASALDVAHSRGLVHRDIKPGNILVERDSGDRAYLTDFGLAKRFDQGTDAGALTRTGAFVGTLDYVAPEQIRGDRVDARTDVYALGCVMYEAIAGKAPFADREENVAKIYAHLQDEPPWLPGDGGTAGSLDEVVARALAKEPGDRYPSAGDLARAAAAATEGQEVLRSAERSVATGKAAPETGEPAAPQIPDTVSSEVAAEPEPEPAATEPFAVAAATTAAHPGPTERVAVPTAATSATPDSSPPGPRWGRIAAAVALVAAVVAVAVIALGGGGGDVTTYEQPILAGELPLLGMPVGITAGEGTIAVATREGRTVALLDEKTGKPTGDAVSLPANGEDVTFADGSLWATVPGADAVVTAKMDGSERTAIDVGAGAIGIASGDGMVWAAEPEARKLASIDTGDQSVSSIPIEAASEPAEVAAGDDVLWVVDRGDGQVFRVDPNNPSAAQGFAVGSNPKGVVVGDDGSVWVANTDAGTVVRLDASGDQQAQVDVGGQPRLMAAGFGRIWVADGDGAVEAINPADESFQKVDVDGSPEGVAIGSDQVWVTTGSGDSVVRIDPGSPR
jgi:serine/threonine-protein kinase